jgi:lipopolysaccharide export system protein LptA
MKGFSCRAIPLVFMLTLILSSALSAEQALPKDQRFDTGSIVVKSKSLEVDNKRKVVVFAGDVDARKDDLVITCQEMLLYYTDHPADKGSGKVGVKIDKIVATGDVKITQPDGALATAEKAIYYDQDEKVVLTGKPVVKQGNDFVEGSSITLFLKEKRSVVEGSEDEKVRAVIFPKKETR